MNVLQKSKCILTPSSEVLFLNPNHPVNNAYCSRQQTHRQSRPRGCKRQYVPKASNGEQLLCSVSIRCSSGLSPQICPGRKRLDSPWNTVWEVNTQGRKSSRGSDKLSHIPPHNRMTWRALGWVENKERKRPSINKTLSKPKWSADVSAGSADFFGNTTPNREQVHLSHYKELRWNRAVICTRQDCRNYARTRVKKCVCYAQDSICVLYFHLSVFKKLWLIW